METNSKFTNLLKYTYKNKLTPGENFLTELFAWILEECPVIFYKIIGENKLFKRRLAISTQTVFELDDKRCFIDLLIKSGNDNYLFEIKWNSKQGEDQLLNYLKICKKHNMKLFYLTKFNEEIDKAVREDNNFLGNIKWVDIYRIVNQLYLDKYQRKKNHKNHALLNNFREFLKENGLGEFDKLDESDLKILENKKEADEFEYEISRDKIQLLLEEVSNELRHDKGIDFRNGAPGNNHYCKQMEIVKNTNYQIRIYYSKNEPFIIPKVLFSTFHGVPDKFDFTGYKKAPGYYLSKTIDKEKLTNIFKKSGREQKDVIKDFIISELKNIGYLQMQL